jgi:hypothetical protein
MREIIKYLPYFGYFVSLIAGIIAAIFGSDTIITLAIILALMGILFSQSLDIRSLIQDTKDQIEKESPWLDMVQKIQNEWKHDQSAHLRYLALVSELREMAGGIFTVHSLAEVYRDDMRRIGRLRKGEVLRSSCPITTASAEEVRRQISDHNYLGTLREHAAASKRGVEVRRLYLLRNREDLSPELLAHLRSIPNAEHQIRIIFREKKDRALNFDFLVFGDHTVSTGIIDVDTGVCDGTRITCNVVAVKSAIEQFDIVWNVASRLPEMV